MAAAKSPKYLTVPDELIEVADAAVDHFKSHGYKVSIEKQELAYPYKPTMVAKRQSTTIIVEVETSMKSQRLDAWAAYGKSCQKDTRVAMVVPEGTKIAASIDKKLRDLGLGLFTATPTALVERAVAQDLALALQLPELKSLPTRLRPLLGTAYEQFGRAQWREAFEDACQALEVESRKYLLKGIKSGRIVLQKPTGQLVTKTPKQVDKMTLGALADTFDMIQVKNLVDSSVGKTLRLINADRVGVVHHKAKPVTEKKLRANVGQHMWQIINALKMLDGSAKARRKAPKV